MTSSYRWRVERPCKPRETVAVFLERWISHRESMGKVRPKVAGT
jgi:hypothetical protein